MATAVCRHSESAPALNGFPVDGVFSAFLMGRLHRKLGVIARIIALVGKYWQSHESFCILYMP